MLRRILHRSLQTLLLLLLTAAQNSHAQELINDSIIHATTDSILNAADTLVPPIVVDTTLPLVYGGFMGCIYAMTWNNSMYHDYSQAYLDISDSDPNTTSYNQFLHTGVLITPANADRYKEIFKKRKDQYRRWRDLSFFVMIGVYALSVIDAYVDAELSVFDISKDLSLKVEPTILNNRSSGNPLDNSSVGLQCSLNF